MSDEHDRDAEHRHPTDRQAALFALASCLLAFVFIVASILAWILSAMALAFLLRRRWVGRREKQ